MYVSHAGRCLLTDSEAAPIRMANDDSSLSYEQFLFRAPTKARNVMLVGVNST